ncbi:MAG TPA: ABC transporter ATP-binding protein [bacterium]|jgi:ABC-2 type transport system ATP-binding protein
MTQAALVVSGITKKFGDLTALDTISLTVNSGETFGLLGPNGAGKSTLINIISGVLAPDSGGLEYYGEKIKEPTIELKQSMGVIPQEISLYGKLSARENLEFYSELYGLNRSSAKGRIDEVLHLVGLADRQNDRISTYSGGMKRRINIAASILHSPKFILMDEPTVGIDPQSRNLIFEVIEKLHELGVTIIYTSHYMEEVERLCHNVSIIDHGKVIANGTKEDLIAMVGSTDLVEIHLENLPEEKQAFVNETFNEMKPKFSDGTLYLNTEKAGEKLGGIIKQINDMGASVTNVRVREPNLESVFLHLTGKGLRD